MPTTTLYLVRHGDASGEEPTNPHLSALGQQQAVAAGVALRHVGADLVMHGSARRTVETAARIASEVGATLRHSDLVEDRTPIPDDWSDVPARYHGFLQDVPPCEADPGGRSLNAAIDELSRISAVDRNLVVVTHNFVIGWIVRHVLDAPWWRWIGLNQANGAISVVRWSTDRAPQLLAFNEQGHLRPHD
jgi:serine/threonine-protein phosphatase PGAM5